MKFTVLGRAAAIVLGAASLTASLTTAATAAPATARPVVMASPAQAPDQVFRTWLSFFVLKQDLLTQADARHLMETVDKGTLREHGLKLRPISAGPERVRNTVFTVAALRQGALQSARRDYGASIPATHEPGTDFVATHSVWTYANASAAADALTRQLAFLSSKKVDLRRDSEPDAFDGYRVTALNGEVGLGFRVRAKHRFYYEEATYFVRGNAVNKLEAHLIFNDATTPADYDVDALIVDISIRQGIHGQSAKVPALDRLVARPIEVGSFR